MGMSYIKQSNSFTSQQIDLQDTPFFFPEGFEKIFMVIYLLAIPYLAGLLFTFFYLANHQLEIFLGIIEHAPYGLTWAIGYEVIATIIMINIFKMAITFMAQPKAPHNTPTHKFKR